MSKKPLDKNQARLMAALSTKGKVAAGHYLYAGLHIIKVGKDRWNVYGKVGQKPIYRDYSYGKCRLWVRDLMVDLYTGEGALQERAAQIVTGVGA